MGPFLCFPFPRESVTSAQFTTFSESASITSFIALLLVGDRLKVFLFYPCSLLIIKLHFWRTAFIKSFLITVSQGPFNLM